jgi:hypothetical protein
VKIGSKFNKNIYKKYKTAHLIDSESQSNSMRTIRNKLNDFTKSKKMKNMKEKIKLRKEKHIRKAIGS